MNLKVNYISTTLFQFFQKHFRTFPWRNTENPYKIMLAEFMLHRTKAEQVEPVYKNFIKKYPDIYSLAKAKKSDIKKVTKHLGLHWRASHFIESAKFIVEEYNGKIPANAKELLKIAGVGEYIAGAILTVCYNKPYPVVDSNIARFINRFYGLNLNGEIRRKKEITEIAGKLFHTKNPGQFLFAIIDFTSLICKPLKPKCSNCILRRNCKFIKTR